VRIQFSFGFNTEQNAFHSTLFVPPFEAQ